MPMAAKPARVTLTGFAADRKSTRLNSSHANISYAVFCLKKKKNNRKAFHASFPTANVSKKEMRSTAIDLRHPILAVWLSENGRIETSELIKSTAECIGTK